MKDTSHKAIAIVGVGAVMPDAPNLPTFWKNIKDGKYSISDVPVDRWDPALYYDEDRKAPAKTYSRIGGWVREFDWNPLKWKMPIPPKVADTMDLTQKWAIVATREALEDFGYPNRALDPRRTAVIFGNAMGGDMHLYSASRILFPEFAQELTNAPSFSVLEPKLKQKISAEMLKGVSDKFPVITEDTMPGELSNIIAGRIAALFNFHGPNYVADAACASAMAAISAAAEGLAEGHYDAVVTGGIDANMSASTYVKFCKIGALSATGTRPYAKGADGFVMGEGSAVFLMKRLEDAERDGDKIYAVLRGLGGSSDGKGKGITAPNPVGQRLAVQRGWENAGVPLNSVSMIEGHGTSTAVGDVAELQCLSDVFASTGLAKQSIALGSVKSNIGHLKGAAGAAGLLKATMCLHEKIIPPSLNFNEPNPAFDFNNSSFYVNTELKPWDINGKGIRRAGVSAFGFGGTNFHAVLEEYIPGRIASERKTTVESAEKGTSSSVSLKTPLRGALVIGGENDAAILNKLKTTLNHAKNGNAPQPAAPKDAVLKAPVRLTIDYNDAEELATKAEKAVKALETKNANMWRVLRAKGVFLGRGPATKTAFLFTGQGSQYVNMLKDLKEKESIVAETFAEADEVMTPLLGKPLSDYIFVNGGDKAKVKEAENDLRQTAITQPAVLATDTALMRLMGAYGVKPDMVMGHSLGEYGALVASGALPFGEALKAVSARGSEMTKVSMEDNGMMAAAFGAIDKVEEIINQIDGYVVIANINSNGQCVIGGASPAVTAAIDALKKAGFTAQALSVSHAFHTKIVAPASEPMGRVLDGFQLRSPEIPLISNVTGDFYPTGPDVKPQMIDLLSQQIASPVQFVKGLNTLYAAGARVFVETGPKRALHGFVEDVLGEKEDVLALSTNHPRLGDLQSFNQALCGFYSCGFGTGEPEARPVEIQTQPAQQPAAPAQPAVASQPAPAFVQKETPQQAAQPGDKYSELGHLFVEFLDKGFEIYSGEKGGKPAPSTPAAPAEKTVTHTCITGAALGLPGTSKVFDDQNIEHILNGKQFIDVIPQNLREAMVQKHITRVVKDSNGNGSFVTIDSTADVIKLAARAKEFNLAAEFGYPEERIPALDKVTALAIASGIDALRDAGIPLVHHYKTTTTGTQLPDRWMLPDNLRDNTGIIFASAFPGFNAYADEMKRYYEDRARHDKLGELEAMRAEIVKANSSDSTALTEIDKRINAVRAEIEKHPYTFERRFLLRVLSMGHSQFAEYIGARGPNTQINSACASTPLAVSLADDWIKAGRCTRVIIVSADDITSDDTLEWFAAGFLATGAAATDEVVEDAAIPFDRRRHGMVVGMGGASIVVESHEAAKERGIQPICEVLSTVPANSAFHGTRLDVNHICGVMEKLVAQAESQWGIDRYQIAPQTVFISHETYTPARGGSASAEINALRHVFKHTADQIVIANTKGFTGHAMATGIEDVVAIKSIETGIVPPVANFKEIDPELGPLNLSKGGNYPVKYALRLGAGFGSQIAMCLLKWVAPADNRHRSPQELGWQYRIVDQAAFKKWLQECSFYENAELEVSHRTLRIKDNGPAAAYHKPATPESTIPVTAPAPAPAVTQAPAPAPQPEPVVAAPAPVTDQVAEDVLKIIAEKTGYPTDMLDMELDLEADLGIDTVKQAEMFAAIRENYNIPRDENLQLRDFPTLRHTIQFVYDNRPDLKTTAQPAAPAPTAQAQPADQGDPVKDKVLQIIADKTGYPTDMLDLELDLEADLGIDTVKQAEVFVAIREEYDIPRDDNLQLRDFPTLAHTIQFVYDRKPDLKAATPAPAVAPAQAAPAVQAAATVAQTAVATNWADPIQEKVLAIIAEKTGYPPEMLDMELDLEADLGIDTVKQAEMFAAIREEYNIPRDENLQLRDFPTLAHTIQFVYDNRPDLKQAQPAAPAAAVPAPAAQEAAVAPTAFPAGDAVQEKVLAIIAEKTGYPPEMLDMELDLEADLGIDTVKQAEMFAAIREAYNIPRDENLQLRDFPTLAHTIQFVYNNRPDLKPAEQPAAPVPAASAPVAQPAQAAPAADGADAVQVKVLELIAEKTGYPQEMLDLELDLEADLGIDTVKQAEMFAAIREEYAIPRDENLQLRDFPTLAHTIQFVYKNRPDLKPAAAAPAAPAPVPEAQPAQAAPAANGADAVQAKVLELIAEKTGYPQEMLDLELDLEADLGIDTVKQAEMFAAIREEYDIPRDENLQLRDFPTLAHTIQFVYNNRPDLKQAPVAETATVPATASETASAPATASTAVTGSMEEANKIPRRVPVPYIRPALDLFKESGVKLEKGSRVIVMSDQGGVGKSLITKLKKLGVEPLVIDDAPTAEDLVTKIGKWIREGAINGIYWLPALDFEGDITKMDLKTWRAATHVRVKLLYTAMRALYGQIDKAGTFLVSATRLGGNHGYDEAGALSPVGGAVCGFTKTYKREKPDTLVKVVDFEKPKKTAAYADLLIAETLRDTGAVEIGYKNGQRWYIGIDEQAVPEKDNSIKFDKETVFVITGAAGSIVSAITSDLAQASSGVFHLLDLTPEPDAKDADLKRFADDKEGLKRDIFQRLKDSGQKATPVMVEKELAKLERLNAALAAISAVKKTGGTVHYHSVNLLDGPAIKKVMQQVKKVSGKVDVLLHAGGLEISRLLPDKSPEEFDLVFDVKSDGWFNLMANLGDMPLGAAVVFSSIAGRFGNGGQTDYSSANDLLCKFMSNFKSTRPKTKGVAIDWTAWGDIGMAARGSIPTIMKAAGIDMLPAAAGIPIVRRELTTAGAQKEVVIAGSLGMMMNEFDETGGLDTADKSSVAKLQKSGGVMTGAVKSLNLYGGLTVATELDPKLQPFLYDHQIGGTPVLPGVMGIEAMVESAKLLYPDLHVAAVEDVNFLAPFKFYRNDPRSVTVQTQFTQNGNGIVANCRLIGERTLHGQDKPQVTTHFTARITLSKKAPQAKTVKAPAAATAKTKKADTEDIYKVYFHGPAYQVMESSWKSGKKVVGQFAQKLPANHEPEDLATLAMPRLIELCFQTAGIWEMGKNAKMGLPYGISEVSILAQPDAKVRKLMAVVTPAKDDTFDAQVVDAKGKVYLALKGYRTMALPETISEDLLKPLKGAIS